MITSEIGLRHLSTIADVATRVVQLPAVATQDWCDSAAEAMSPIRLRSMVSVTIAEHRSGEHNFVVEATGGCCSVPGPAGAEVGRIHSDNPRGMGWSFDGVSAQSSDLTARVGRLRDLPSWTQWPVTPAGKRWARLGAADLLVASVPLHPENSRRILAVEFAVAREQQPFARSEAVMLSSLMEPLRRRAAVAFGKEQTTSFNRITPREQEILEQLTLGRTVRDIAAGLSRSPHTVHDHVKSLHRKLQATSRGELIARYLGHIKSCGDTAPAGPAGPDGGGEATPQAAKPQVVTRIDQQASMRATA